jgi:imidazolonepropionase-like amidohydrolase
MPETKSERRRGEPRPVMTSTKDGAFAWNEALKSEFRAYENFTTNDEKAKEYRNLGFGTVLSQRMDGISRGSAVLVTLQDEREHKVIISNKAAHVLSFNKGTSTMDYPTSLMGSIALLRQTYYDAQWYKTQREEFNTSLSEWNNLQALPQIFMTNDKLDALRAVKLGKEFNVNYILKAGGDEYKRLDAIKATGAPFIVPIKYPEALDVEDPLDALQVDLSDMKHWEMASSNAGRMDKAGIQIALTLNGLKKKEDFWPNLRKTIEAGLSEEAALKALTATPAKIINVDDVVGSLAQGKLANFIITNGNIFNKETKIYHNWVQGTPYIVSNMDNPSIVGVYNVIMEGQTYKLQVEGTNDKPEMWYYKSDTTKYKVDYQLGNRTLGFSFSPSGEKMKTARFNGTINSDKTWSGNANLPDGRWAMWQAVFVKDFIKNIDKKEEKKEEKKDVTEIGSLIFPFVSFGNKEIPKSVTFLFKNATVWTNEKEGVLKETDVLVQNGKIMRIGQGISVPNATEIDATGRHLTAGIIDEHSHIAISRGVNEGSQESSAEVRIGDVVDSEDNDIYRNLAGGVTSSHLLHGSANPIGGQTQLIKLRWGMEPEQLKFQNWDPFIKFALGENVKQSNAGDNNYIRYPQTRMGVEEVFEDYFTRAEEYAKLKLSGKPYRRDLDLETIQEILEKRRFITCHSYVQSEIVMLMRVAERHNFRINTFTHILEGYKVADKMAKHGVGASTFSDWWDYKYEVYNAIPYNAAMMHEQGVVVAINSDDAEMSRRLNQEAAKAVEYGGVSEEEAWKMVTLNPAKLLHVADRTGSISIGKDADLVLWSNNPLSVYAKADMTMVDGVKYFDRTDDEKMRTEVQTERNRLIQKMLLAKKVGEAVLPVTIKTKKHYHCDDVEVEVR